MKFVTQQLMKLKKDRDYAPMEVRIYDKLTDAMNDAEKTISSFQRQLPFLGSDFDDVKIVIYSAEEMLSYQLKGDNYDGN